MFEKVEDKAKEVAGEVQEKYGELTDDCGHQIKGAACKIAARGVWLLRRQQMLYVIMWKTIPSQQFPSARVLAC